MSSTIHLRWWNMQSGSPIFGDPVHKRGPTEGFSAPSQEIGKVGFLTIQAGVHSPGSLVGAKMVKILYNWWFMIDNTRYFFIWDHGKILMFDIDWWRWCDDGDDDVEEEEEEDIEDEGQWWLRMYGNWMYIDRIFVCLVTILTDTWSMQDVSKERGDRYQGNCEAWSDSPKESLELYTTNLTTLAKRLLMWKQDWLVNHEP